VFSGSQKTDPPCVNYTLYIMLEDFPYCLQDYHRLVFLG